MSNTMLTNECAIISETVTTPSYQILYFLELYEIINLGNEESNTFVQLNTPMDVVSLYGNLAQEDHYKDFLHDLKTLEQEFQERYRFIKLAGCSDYLH